MTDLANSLLAGFRTTHFNVGVQLGDLENADAVRRTRGDSGSSISWIVGHLLSARCQAIKACGIDHPDPYEEKFSFQSPAADGSDYQDIAELREVWNDTHEKLCEAISQLTAEQLLGESSLPSPHGDNSLLGALSFTAWHEAYHSGVIGLLRVQWGLRHTHVVAMEAMGM